MCHEGPVIAKWTEIHESDVVSERQGQLFASNHGATEDQDDLKLYCTACEYTWVPERGSVTIT